MTTIDFAAEVDKRKDALMEDLYSLLRINSAEDKAHADAENPFGPGPRKALDAFLKIAERDGYSTKNYDNYVGHFEYENGAADDAEVLGIIGHLDVVPAGSGWDSDPFEPEIRDGNLYARGASDDKGPTMACYYGLKILKELDVKLSKKIRFIVGTNEETGWADMDYYFEHCELPKPDFGFSPDAEFPIINGEKGILSYEVTFALKTNAEAGDFDLVSFKSGLRTNMVPGDATAVLKVNDGAKVADMKAAFDAFIEKSEVKGEFAENNGEITITVIGKGAHAQEPKFGVNSATFLAAFLADYNLDGNGANYIQTIAEYMHLDYNGKKLNAYTKHDVMGETTSSANLFDYSADGDKKVTLNVRHPEGIDKDTILANMEEVLKAADVSIAIIGDVKTPHYVPATDPLVKTLLDVYEEHTGLEGHEESIGGGTYGRILERGVAYGAMFPGEENVMHQPNEFMPIDSLFKATAIYADAIYRLVK